VIKADGLAGGKGVMVCGSLDEALQAVENLESIAGRQACNQILIEERLEGREVSLLLFSDGKDFRVMPPVRDHKRLSDGDAGPNTGGMGTVCSDDLIDDDMMQLLRESVVQPTLEGASADGFPFKGVLFIGLMITPNGPMVLEYNVRLGDPETQSLMIRLETPLIDILKAIEGGTLGALEVNWRRGVSATVVLATHGYPHSPRKGDLIEGLESVEQTRDLKVFHAGTGRDDRGGFVTTGGRVLGVSSFGSDLDEALGRVYEAARQIRFEGMQYRKDIGR
jgi:phosphoribosylamine--glycine ligase